MSYAYFLATATNSASTSINVTTQLNGGVNFTPGSPINIIVNLDNFAPGEPSLTGSTTSKVDVENKSQDQFTQSYNVYINIPHNNFVYSLNKETPERILFYNGEIAAIGNGTLTYPILLLSADEAAVGLRIYRVNSTSIHPGTIFIQVVGIGFCRR